MAHTITIPDVGDIDFPDSMSDTDIAATAKRLHATAQVGKTGPVSRFVSNAMEQANPVTLLQGMGETLLHPIEAGKRYLEQNADLAGKTAESFKSRHYLEGVRHGLNLALNAVPGLGAASDAAGGQINEGDVAGGLGKAAGAGLAVVEGSKLPAVARGAAEVVNAAPSVIKAAAKAGGADIASGVLKAGTGAAVQALPIPSALKFGAGFEMGREGAKQIGRGVKAGYKAGAEVVKQRGVIPPTPNQPPGPEPFTPEEQALADHVMRGTEPQPSPAGAMPETPLAAAQMPATPQTQPGMPANPTAALRMPGAQQTAVGEPMPENPTVAAKKLSPGAADAKALSDKLGQWDFTPDEAKAMNEKGWIKLAFDSGVKLPSAAVRKNAIFNLIKDKAGPPMTAEQLFEKFRAAGK